jgi:transcriptional regulator with XRE-family HTH domain
MSFRSWREQKRLSQEKVAEMTGLSLRTIQRLEAGHRVSYASLRALAATFRIDVDVLERELYAMKNSTEDFVEIPRWVRLLDGKRWFGGPGLCRRDLHLIEAFCLGCALIVIAGSFVVASKSTAKVLGTIGFIEVVCAYLVSVNIRIGDKYRLWPEAGATNLESPPMNRKWHAKTAGYAYLFGVGILGTVILCWLLF